ncbi:MAG: DUF1365 domain-containing protein [Opitutales bacterium]
MNSVLFECRLLHHRLRPRKHRFANRIFFFALDLAEADELANRCRLFSHNTRNVYTFCDRDFLRGTNPLVKEPAGTNGPPLVEKVRCYLSSRGIDGGADLRVVLVGIPRICGYLFNPVSFYFCFSGARPLCAVAEVTNTFREVKLYLLEPDTWDGKRFSARIFKDFYVSPFSDSGGAFDFSLEYSRDRLSVTIDEYEQGKLMLHSAVTGRRKDLSDWALLCFALKYPLLGLQVMAGIHIQALRLYLKRLPWRRKADQVSLQKDFYHPKATSAPMVPEKGEQ